MLAPARRALAARSDLNAPQESKKPRFPGAFMNRFGGRLTVAEQVNDCSPHSLPPESHETSSQVL
jgi:hypothetical protein